MKWLVPESSGRYVNRMTNESLHKGSAGPSPKPPNSHKGAPRGGSQPRPPRVLPEGAGGQRAVHVDRAVRALAPATHANYLRGRCWPPVRAPPLVAQDTAVALGCTRARQPPGPGVWTLFYLCIFKLGGARGGTGPQPSHPPTVGTGGPP